MTVEVVGATQMTSGKRKWHQENASSESDF